MINLLILYALIGVLVGGFMHAADDGEGSPYVWGALLWPMLLLLLFCGAYLTVLLGGTMKIVNWLCGGK